MCDATCASVWCACVNEMVVFSGLENRFCKFCGIFVYKGPLFISARRVNVVCWCQFLFNGTTWQDEGGKKTHFEALDLKY